MRANTARLELGEPSTGTGYRNDTDYGVALCQFVRTCLPHLNARIDAGAEAGCLVAALDSSIHEYLAMDLATVLTTLAVRANGFSLRNARRTLGALGFVLTSLESHHQNRGGKPGQAVRSLSAESALLALARAARLPPYANVDSMWLDNPVIDADDPNDAPLTLTDDRGELWFHESVKLTNRMNLAAVAALGPLALGEIAIDSDDGWAAMRKATGDILLIRARYTAFMRPVRGGGWPINPEFFATVFRTKLVRYPVGPYTGAAANALHLASQSILDFIIGTTDDSYSATVERSFPHMAIDDPPKVREAMTQPSITERMIDLFGLDPATVTASSNYELARLIAAQPEGVRRTALVYSNLARAWAGLSGVHWRLIDQFLIRYASAHPDRSTQLVAPLNAGRSGESFVESRAILDMRRRHPVVSKIVVACRSDARK
jgi:hypothetical protein